MWDPTADDEQPVAERIPGPLGVKASQLNILVATALIGVVRPAEICERLQLAWSDASYLGPVFDRLRVRQRSK